MTDNFYRKGEGEIRFIMGLAFLGLFLGLIVLGILWLFGFNFGTTAEGIVKYDDCRQVITVKSDDYWQKYFHKFICNTYKTQGGVVMGGECVRIEKDQSYPTPLCARAYVYTIEPPTNCKDVVKNGVPYPYLGYDDMCYTTPQ